MCVHARALQTKGILEYRRLRLPYLDNKQNRRDVLPYLRDGIDDKMDGCNMHQRDTFHESLSTKTTGPIDFRFGQPRSRLALEDIKIPIDYIASKRARHASSNGCVKHACHLNGQGSTEIIILHGNPNRQIT